VFMMFCRVNQLVLTQTRFTTMNPAIPRVIPVHRIQRTDTLIDLTHLLTFLRTWSVGLLIVAQNNTATENCPFSSYQTDRSAARNRDLKHHSRSIFVQTQRTLTVFTLDNVHWPLIWSRSVKAYIHCVTCLPNSL